MSEQNLNLVQWEARVGALPSLVNALAFDLYLDGRSPANAVAEAVRTLDMVGHKGFTQNGGRVNFRTREACKAAAAEFREMSREISEAKDSLRKASTPEPWSASRTSNWIARLGGLPDYIQHVSHGIKRSNPALSTGEAIQRAIGVVKDWARGGKNVDAGTRAAAAKAIAEWEALKAKQHAKSGARKATESVDTSSDELHGKLLAAASRLAYVIAPTPNQATFAIRYGKRMTNFEGLHRALAEGKPLAVEQARKLLDLPEGLPFEFVLAEFEARKEQTMILLEALGYGSTPIRATHGRKGSYHGMHGHERAVRKRKLIPGEPEHPVVDAIKSGGTLNEAPVVPAGPFDPTKHPRAGHGQFGPGGGAKPTAKAEGGAQAPPTNGNAVARAIQANDPQFRDQMKATAEYAASHQPQAAGVQTSSAQLQALGYATDPSGIVQFQKDNNLPTSGKLDEGTLATVSQIYSAAHGSAASKTPDFTGIKGAGVTATPGSRTASRSRGGPGARGGSRRGGAAPGRKTLGKTAATNVNEAMQKALAEAIGDEPLVVMIANSKPAGWQDSRERDEDRDDFDFDDDPVDPPNLREGNLPTVCQTCAHFSPHGWITRRRVQGGCMKYSSQVDRTDVCDSYLTLSPPDATLRIHEARLQDAVESGDNMRIVAARAVLKSVKQRDDIQEAVRREEEVAEAFRIMESASGVVEAVDLSAEGRKKLASKGHALGDGSYPIPNVEFLKKAISAYGRAVAAGKGKKVKSWIVKRARALGAESLLPEGWLNSNSGS